MISRLKNHAHIWLLDPARLSDSGKLSAFQKLLSEDELLRYQRFRFDRDRHHFLVSHAMLRKVLSSYADVLPHQWQFVLNEHGKPELAASHQLPWLRFNLSHTEGLVACVITDTVDCGIDVENRSRRCDYQGIARRMFSPDENRHLQQLDAGQQADYFFRLWTLKEAYVKARGLGLSLSTSKINFKTETVDRITASFDADLDENSQDWLFSLHQPTRQHTLATAVRRNGDEAVKLVFKNSLSNSDF